MHSGAGHTRRRSEKQMGREEGNSRGPRWKGPLGLSPEAKKRWSENQRQAELKNDPEWVAKEKARQQRREDKRSRQRLPQHMYRELTVAGMHVQRGVGGKSLTYLDREGNLHREDRRSAEQVIADFLQEEAQKKGSQR